MKALLLSVILLLTSCVTYPNHTANYYRSVQQIDSFAHPGLTVNVFEQGNRIPEISKEDFEKYVKPQLTATPPPVQRAYTNGLSDCAVVAAEYYTRLKAAHLINVNVIQIIIKSNVSGETLTNHGVVIWQYQYDGPVWFIDADGAMVTATKQTDVYSLAGGFYPVIAKLWGVKEASLRVMATITVRYVTN